MSKLRIAFMGTPEFAVPALTALHQEFTICGVFTQPDKPVGRGLKLTPSPVKAKAQALGIPVFTPEKVSVPEEVARIKSWDCQAIVVVAYGQILKTNIIESTPWGCINIHSSLLPRWRGAAPIHHALLAGDAITGVTTMRIVPKLDAGAMYLKESTPIQTNDTLKTLHDRLSEIGARLIVKTLHTFNDITPQEQDDTLVTHAGKITKEMGQITAWTSAKEIDRKVRALNPWPGVEWATAPVGVLKIKTGLLRPDLTPDQNKINLGPQLQNGQAFIHAKDGVYEITEVQEAGKRAQPFKDFWNGAHKDRL